MCLSELLLLKTLYESSAIYRIVNSFIKRRKTNVFNINGSKTYI